MQLPPEPLDSANKQEEQEESILSIETLNKLTRRVLILSFFTFSEASSRKPFSTHTMLSTFPSPEISCRFCNDFSLSP